METELLKYGIAGLALYCMMRIVLAVLESRRPLPVVKNGNGSRAGDMAPEVYLLRFDKLDNSFAGMIKIMDKQTEILSDIRDWVMRQEGKEK